MAAVNRAVATALAGGYEPRRYDTDGFGWPRVASGMRPPYEGRHRRAEDEPAGRHRAPESADLTDEDLRDAHVELASLPLTHGEIGEGWAITGRHHHHTNDDTALTGS